MRVMTTANRFKSLESLVYAVIVSVTTIGVTIAGNAIVLDKQIDKIHYASIS